MVFVPHFGNVITTYSGYPRYSFPDISLKLKKRSIHLIRSLTRLEFWDNPDNFENCGFSLPINQKKQVKLPFLNRKNVVNIYKISLRATSLRHGLNLMTLYRFTYSSIETVLTFMTGKSNCLVDHFSTLFVMT